MGPSPALMETVRGHKIYTSPNEIEYSPEVALEEGHKMLHAIKDLLVSIKQGNKGRQHQWYTTLRELEAQKLPERVIAVCGVSGAGKSSILNAILDDNIVPTSGVRACTAVVTEIGYHAKTTIEAEISFLSEAEWTSELKCILEDVLDAEPKDRDGISDSEEVKIAESKLRAVYPTLQMGSLDGMTSDKLIESHPLVHRVLGATAQVIANGPEAFGEEIAKYIDSESQLSGDTTTAIQIQRKALNQDKEAGSGPPNNPGLDPRDEGTSSDTEGAAAISGGRSVSRNPPKADSLDPFEALDIEGSKLWPLIKNVKIRCNASALKTGTVLCDLPGTADANAARNSIAKKYMKDCESVWIVAPAIRAVDDKIARDLMGDAFKVQLENGKYDASAITFVITKTDDLDCSKIIADLNLKDNSTLQEIKRAKRDNRDGIRSAQEKINDADTLIKKVEDFKKVLDRRTTEWEACIESLEETQIQEGKGKRKTLGDGGSAAKRRRTLQADGHDDRASFIASIDEALGEDPQDHSEAELKLAELRVAREDLTRIDQQVTQERIAAVDSLRVLERQKTSLQLRMKTFCSHERSKWIEGRLCEQFREGLREQDAGARSKGYPSRDYDSIKASVYSVCSRDYERVKRKSEDDGEPSCFENVEDTGVPDLQNRCRSIPFALRELATRDFFRAIIGLATTVVSYLLTAEAVTPDDCQVLRDLFKTRLHNPQATGITAKLDTSFCEIASNYATGLKETFHNVLRAELDTAALEAVESALKVIDEIISDLRWNTLRAIIRRDGIFKAIDLNEELAMLMIKHTASCWGEVFESDFLDTFQNAASAAVDGVLQEVQSKCPAGLKESTGKQAELTINQTSVAMGKVSGVVHAVLQAKRKDISRSITPSIQESMMEGYSLALAETGRGVKARQKAILLDYLAEHEEDIFLRGTNAVMDRLDLAADAVGAALTEELSGLAKEVEVSMAVLWEHSEVDHGQIAVRKVVIERMNEIIQQASLWLKAHPYRPTTANDEQTP
ncbi:hypothetical protein DL93DRAFT_2230442 [Clavulina sp. PMI_390]|nr:hypothetical protein DL93DRAFT_2230442 [Clavulina sp. PMI_390]